MSKFTEKIKIWYEKILSLSRIEKRHKLSPVRDWRIMLSTAFIILSLEIIFTFYLYEEIDKGKFFQVDETNSGQQVKLNDILLQKIAGQASERETQFNKLKQGGGIKGEPSA